MGASSEEQEEPSMDPEKENKEMGPVDMQRPKNNDQTMRIS